MIFSGFLLASVLAVPLGILMGSFKVVEALFEPIAAPCATCRSPPSSRS